MGLSCCLSCQAAGGKRHCQDSMTFSSAHSPCQLHKEGSFSLHCQVVADPVFSNTTCRQCQHQLLGANSESLSNFQSNWFIHLLPQSFLCERELTTGTSQFFRWPCLWGSLSLWWWWRPGRAVCSDALGASGCWFSESWPPGICWSPCVGWWSCGCGASDVFLTVPKDTFLQTSSSSSVWNWFINCLSTHVLI